MLSIYQYSTAHQFLKDSWEEKQKKNSRFSIRAWAKAMGFDSHASLNRILNGKRKIPKRYIPLFIKSLELTPKEGIYLETLVDFERARDIEQKDFYQERLRDMAPKESLSFREVECFRYLKDPLHMIILEMTHLQDFKLDLQWIREHLIIKRSIKEIDEAIDRLMVLGLLVTNSEGNAKATNAHLTNVADVANRGVQSYHKNVSQLALESIEKQDVLQREFQGHAMAIKKSKIPKAKQLMRKFVEEFIKEVEDTSDEGEEVYQLNMQFFGLTNRE